MRGVERAASEIATTELPVFIVGESGTGKDTLALAIHRLSRRAHTRFTKVNCATLPPMRAELPRSELDAFGFTKEELGGTVLLDQVLELHPSLQPHVIDLLPEDSFALSEVSHRLPRIIASTCHGESAGISELNFNRELYYRLRAVLLRVPPLRDRKEDIPLLVDFLVNKYAPIFGRTMPKLSHRVEERLLCNGWPGNVRELENAVKTLLAFGDEDLWLESAATDSGQVSTNAIRSKPVTSLKEVSRIASLNAEKALISDVLTRTRWNRRRAAEELKISYKALLYKLKQTGLVLEESGNNNGN